MPKLPYEIWLYVTTFLNRETVLGLYPVNRDLFNIAINARYQDICVGCSSSTLSNHADWPGIRNAFSASRVKRLTIHSENLGLTRHDSNTSNSCLNSCQKGIGHQFLSTLAFLLSRLAGLNPYSSIIQRVIENIPSMVSLTTLHIWLDSMDNDPHHLSKLHILQTGWPIFGPRLLALTVKVPLEDLEDVLPPPSVVLSNLESFTVATGVSLSALSVGNATALLCRNLLPFLHLNGLNLRVLAVEAKENVDLSAFLSQLPSMPSLSHFRFLHNATDLKKLSGNLGLHHFLNAYRTRIRALELQLTVRGALLQDGNRTLDVDDSYAQNIYKIGFQQLNILRFNIPHPQSAAHLERTILYVRQYLDSLTFLELTQLPLTLNQLKALFEREVPGCASDTLRRLHIDVDDLSVDMLLLLARRLPRLRDLKIVYKSQVSSGSKSFRAEGLLQSRIPEFCSSIHQIVFSEWNLHSLDIEPKLLPGPLRNQTSAAVFRAIPSLQTFSGQDRPRGFSSDSEFR